MTQLFNLNSGNEITSLDGAYGFYVVTVDSEGNPVQSGFVTLDILKTFINTDPSVVPSSNPWRGCRVALSSNQSISSGAFVTVSWQSETIDTDGIWSIGAPTRLTVPTGVTKVRVSTSILWDSSTTGIRGVSLRMNGSPPVGAFAASAPASSAVNNFSAVNATSGAISVTEGDYFELRATQTSGSPVVITANARTWFEMEIIEATV